MRRWGLLLSFSLVMAGCEGATNSKQPGGTSESSASADAVAVKRYAPEDLPSVEDFLPPLDDGRVELAPPKGWRLLPRDPKYLVRLVKGEEDNSLPRLTVQVEDAAEEVSDVTEGNMAQFAAQMEKRSAAVAGRKILEPERPIVLGKVIWSRHVRQLRYHGGQAAVQSLTTARGGRIYRLELTVDSPGDSTADFAKALLAHRDAAYALAANWKFSGAASEASTAASAKDEPPTKADPAKTGATTAEAPGGNSPEKNPD
jgi:hypothetical protein